ncbi:MAG TPA: hypothetical protein VFE58_12170 [Tepidisphaeraceae bacterium]|nr:hypothetical protein [Tepidisphaeraceae bacterium]
MEVALVNPPDGNVVARGRYLGGPDYEFITADDGHIDFRVVGDTETVWAGPNATAFRAIASAWNRYTAEVRQLSSEAEQLRRVARMRQELLELGALPSDPPPNPEPLWSLLVFEAENGLS